jgi:phosphoserine phosphatase
VVLQVDATVSRIDGLTWLTNRRDVDLEHRLTDLQREAAAQRWSWAELTRARLKQLRPRRAEINELGAAYLAAMMPGAVDAVRAMRRAGISIALASDVAAEALFGVATALGVSPDELRAPRLRFDAIGAYVGCDLGGLTAADAGDASTQRAAISSPRTLFVGTRRSESFAARGTDPFIAFSGVVAREGRADAKATVATFHDLSALVLR